MQLDEILIAIEYQRQVAKRRGVKARCVHNTLLIMIKFHAVLVLRGYSNDSKLFIDSNLVSYQSKWLIIC